MERAQIFRPIYLRRVNDLLTIVVVGLAVYIFILPFLPTVSWWVRYEMPVLSHPPSVVVPAQDPVPLQNTLVIPALALREEVFGGNEQNALAKGIWHIPNTSSPEKGGNTIMAGHRFTYNSKAVFYYLDKVALSDVITLYWQGKRYDYVVTAINTVPPTNSSLVAQTPEPTLTLYTCTPLWSAKDRLVITAKLVEAY